MIREKLIESGVGAGGKFRWRSREVSRLEGLADAVFGFAITLLVVSLEVPRTFDELLAMVATFPAFAISFALLLLVWYQHYVYFRRYDIEDGLTMVLNSALLFASSSSTCTRSSSSGRFWRTSSSAATRACACPRAR